MMQTNTIFSGRKKFNLSAACLMLVLVFAATVHAQTTEFTYQGKLSVTGTQAATFDFEFRLCASESNPCSPPLAVSIQSGVPVSNMGIFTVKLNFGAAQFDGANRFLEIAVRRAGETSYTTLEPRQKITSAPYSVQSLTANDALNLGGTAANQYVKTDDPRLAANNYVQNGTTAQPNVNFNISGTGTAGVLNAATQFNLGGERILGGAAGTDNLFAGRNSGAANAGSSNSFFGTNSGRLNAASNNSFFGFSAGEITSTGASNSFFGGSAGLSNTNGKLNSFFGVNAGYSNTGGDNNAFFGVGAGLASATGNNNTFLGYNAATTNVSGGSNTIIGANANVGANNLTYAAAIGANAFAAQSNSIILGSINGVNGATADTRVGIGVTAPTFKLQIVDRSNAGLRVQTNQTGGTIASFGGNGAFQVDTPTLAGGRFSILENGNVGIGNNAPTFKLQVVDASNKGLRVQTNAAGGTIASFGGDGAFQVDAPGIPGGRFTIGANGNVGIGNVSPTAKLEVTGNGTSSTALEINNGAIKVTGAGLNTATAVFVIEKNSTTVCSSDLEDFIVINNPYTNNDPNAVLFITPVYSSRSAFSAYANIYYETTGFSQCPVSQNKWVIRLGANGSSPTLRFNVMVIKP